MKKLFAVLLSLCMILSCTSVSAFAAETFVEDVNPSNVSTYATARNINYYTFSDNSVLDGTITIKVTPGSGEALKIHLYIISGSVKVQVKKSSALLYTTVRTFKNAGHNYADLVSSTNGGTYYVRLTGTAAWFNGGIYSE